MTLIDWSDAKWRKSTRSAGNGGDCVEVASTPEAIGVRDSKNQDGAVLTFRKSEWQAFIDGVKNSEFDQI